MKDANSPVVLWDYCVERRARINNLTARNLFSLQGQNAHFTVTGEEGDISNLCKFGWCDWCCFRDHNSFPMQREILGRVLGPAKGEGNEMSQWVLKANGRVVPRRTCRPLTTAEMNGSSEQSKRNEFDRLIQGRWGSTINLPKSNVPAVTVTDDEDEFIEHEDEDESPRVIPEIDEKQFVDSRGKPMNVNPPHDTIKFNCKTMTECKWQE